MDTNEVEVKIGKFLIRRDGIRWMYQRQEGDTLVIGFHRIPPWPPQYNKVIHVTPRAMSEGAEKVTFDAVNRLLRNAQETDKALRAKGKKGLNWSTLTLLHTPHPMLRYGSDGSLPDGEPGTENLNSVFAWKALGK